MLPVFISVLVFVAAVFGADSGIEFVSPGPSVSNVDPSISNAIHPVGSDFHVAWTAGTNLTRATSVVLFQYDGKDLVYPFEYVTTAVLDTTSVDWTVATDKNLSFSNLFLFNIFYDGDTSPTAVSETFNITDTSKSSTSTTSPTSSITSTSPTFATSLTSSVASSTGGGTAGKGSASNESGSGGMATAAKIGIGIAVPVVALLGIAAGYFLFRHRTKKQQ